MTEDRIYRIAIADDEKLFLNGLAMVIDQHPQFNSSILAQDGQDLISKIKDSEGGVPDLVLTDMEMPIKNGIDVTKELNQHYPEIKIVILSSHYEPTLILKMLELGASAYMAKNEEPEEVYNTMLGVIKNGFHYNQFVVNLIRDKMFLNKKAASTNIKLTLREQEILNLICEQKTNKEIGDQLFISKRTVEGHRNKLLEKTNSKNTAGLIIFAIQYGHYDIDLKLSQWNKFNNLK